MALSSVEDYALQGGGNLIDLDDYIKSPVFQLANKNHRQDCVIDVGTFGERLAPEPKLVAPEYDSFRNQERYSSPARQERRCAGDRRDASEYESRRRGRDREACRTSGDSESSYTGRERGDHKQYSLDSGVSDGCRYRHRKNSPVFHSNVDFYEARRKLERRDNGRAGRRSSRTCQDPEQERSQASIINTLKQQQEKIDRLAALCEECLQPRMAEPAPPSAAPAPTSAAPAAPTAPAKAPPPAPDTSSSDLSSSLPSGEDIKKQARQMKRLDCKNECKTYKIIMRKLDELNQHLVCKQLEQRLAGSSPARAKSWCESKTVSESVSVSDKGVCTELGQKARMSARRRRRKPLPSRTSTSEQSGNERSRQHKNSSPRPSQSSVRRHGASPARGRVDSAELDSRRRTATGVYSAFTNNDMRSEDSDGSKLYGINDYNLHDPISFYNHSKRLNREKLPPVTPAASYNLCWLCRGIWRRLRVSEFCKQILCCGDGISVASNLLGEKRKV